MEHESDGDSCRGWYTWDYSQRIGKGIAGLGNKRTSRDHLEYNIVNLVHNTEKSSGDLRRLGVTQTPVRNHQLTIV